jgi:uncharacterized tellurite resistance protein B-like protein
MSIATADGHLGEEESATVSGMVEYLFSLDEGLRDRVDMLRELLARHPAKLTGLTSKLVATRTPEQRGAIGRLLVSIAAVDGVVTKSEHRSLRALYKSLGLPAATLDGAIGASGARLEDDALVAVTQGSAPASGSRVTAPEQRPPSRVNLDQAAIDAILADTREVATMLAGVLDTGEDESSVSEMPTPSVVPLAATPTHSTAVPAAFAEGLDTAYRPVLEELLTREHWRAAGARALASKYGLMPSAIVDTINSWADGAVGDYLITEDEDGWTLRLDLITGRHT